MEINQTSEPATGSPEPSPPSKNGSKPVGLLVVHGIGDQKRGETLDGVLEGLDLTYGNQLHVQRKKEDYALVEGLNRPIHIFEVYWADLLRGETVKETFKIDRIFEVVWFPLYNYKEGLFEEWFSRSKVLGWTWALAPLSAFLATGIRGAQFLATIPSGINKSRIRNQEYKANRDKSGKKQPEVFWDRVRREMDRTEKEQTFVDNILDEVAGDVFNYVHGVGEAFPEENDKTGKIGKNTKVIQKRFQQTVQRAIDEGCKELQVLAHSLGTVIAFRSMCSEEAISHSKSKPPLELSHFYTIGSPLEKFRFFWPGLLENSKNGPAITAPDEVQLIAADRSPDGGSPMNWDNFYNRSDLVSGQLLSFDGWPKPTNHKAQGLGGMIRSHVSYNRNPKFLSLLGKGLTGEEPTIKVSRSRLRMQRFIGGLENLLLPTLLVTFAILGLIFMAGVGGSSGWIISQPFEWMGLEGVARGIRIYFFVFTIFGLTILPIWVGRNKAREQHAKYWSAAKGNRG